MKINKPICDSYVSAMNAMGHSTIFDAAGQQGGLSGGSTDMGGLQRSPGPAGLFFPLD
jgi:hypothetical protein